MSNFYKIFIFLLVAFLNFANAQTYYHKLYTVKEGLSQTQVISLLQDNKGYLWVGTNGGGVNIFDGKSFKNITTDEGLAGNIVFSIVSDNEGNIWFGTDQGVCKYDGKKFVTYDESNGLPHKYVYSLMFRKNGDLVIGTFRGVGILNNNSIVKLEGNENLDNTTVFSIIEKDDNELWFGTGDKGVIGFTDNKYIEYTVNDGLFHNQIWNLNFDSKNRLWVSTSNGLNYISEGVVKNADHGGTYMNSLKIDNNNMIFVKYDGWIVTYKDTVNIDSKLFRKTRIRKVIKDMEGNFWFGTEKGLIKFPKNKFINYNESHGLHHNNVFAIIETQNNNYWIGATADGFSQMRLNKLTHSPHFKNYQYKPDSSNVLPSGRVFGVTESSNSELWFATWGGVSIFNPKLRKFTNYTSGITNKQAYHEPNLTSEHLNTMFKDSKGVIWIGTDNGLTQYYNGEFHNFNNEYKILKGKKILNIFEDRTRNIWISSANGFYKYNGHTVRHFSKREGFVDDIVNTIVQDGEKYYWIATKRGIYRSDGSDFENISKEDGLSSNNIYLLGYDNNKLYIGTNKGLDVLNTKLYNKEDSICLEHYGELEGFIGVECNRNAYMKSKDGKLWFGTVAGITIMDPKVDDKNKTAPNTFINDVKLDFKDIDWQMYADTFDNKTGLPINLVLPYNKNHLTFNFTGVSLTISEKVKYKYMLEGLDDNWSPPLYKDEADYPVLPPGDYTFKVIACNNDGIWNETPTSFKFTIKPPFWRTTWFYISAAAIAFILIFLFIKWREANLRKEKRVLEQKVQERTAEIREQKEIVEQKNKDITDSINYAKNIQEAILPSTEEFNRLFPSSFIYYMPRDIVSGDFYWTAKKDNRVFFAASDCTGHGVPGAFMSILGITLLDEIINTNPKVKANELLNQLRDNVIDSLKQTGRTGEQKDGMDIALGILNLDSNQLEYAGANNPLYLIRNREFIEYKASKMPIGYHYNKEDFKNNIIDLQKDDKIYLFSDGYADQFGGPKGKKFKYKPFKQLLIESSEKTMQEQNELINKTILDWMGNIVQLDDILVLGIHII